MAKKTEQTLKELKSTLQSDYQARDQYIRYIRAVRNGEVAVKIPKAFLDIGIAEPIKTRLSADAVKRIVAVLTTSDPIVRIRPYDQTIGAQEDSDLKEKWANAALSDIERRQGESVLDSFVQDVVVDGVGFLKCLYTPHMWGDIPTLEEEEAPEQYLARSADYRRRTGPPFILQAPDPLTVYPVWGDTGLVGIMEIVQRPQAELISKYKLKVARDGTLVPASAGGYETFLRREGSLPYVNRTSEWGEFWDESWAYYFVDGHLVHSFEHKLGRVPYFPAIGIENRSRPFRERGTSVVEELCSLELALDSLLTMKQTWAKLGAYPTRIKVVNPDDVADAPGELEQAVQAKPIKVELGFQETVFTGEDIRYLIPPPIGRDLNEMAQILRTLGDRQTIASVLYGQWPGSDSSGWMVAQLMAAAKSVYGPISKNTNRATAEMLSFLFEVIDRQIGLPVPVYGSSGKRKKGYLEIGPKEIRGYYQCEVERKVLVPSDEIPRGTYAAQMAQQGYMSTLRAMEKYMDVDNPTEELDRIFAERLMKHPLIQDAEAARVLQETGLLALLAQPPPGSPAGQVAGGIGEAAQTPGQMMQPGTNVPLAEQTPPGGPVGAPGGGRAAGVGRQPGGPQQGA